MRKLISCLLAVVMVFTMVSAFAEPVEPIQREDNVVIKFLKETDAKTKDIALQLQSGDQVADLVLHVDGDNLHLLARENGNEAGHLQLTTKGLYVELNGAVTKLDYATLVTFLQGLIKDVDDAVTEAVDSIPAEQLPTEAELQQAVQQAAAVAAVASAQAQADAATLLSASATFASKFKPEYILDVKETDSGVEINLRGDAFASALADAVDDLMMDPALAKLVDRQAALTGSKSFAECQKDWLTWREATLQAVRTIQSSDSLDEDGHWRSHFQIGEEVEDAENNEVLVCDMDTWVSDEDTEAEMVFTLGLKDAEPLVKYEMAVNPYYFWQKQTAPDAVTEMRYDLDDDGIKGGIVKVAVADQDELNAEFGRDYLYMRGSKGGIFTSVRETWTGKIRYELFAETAEGQESSVTVDFYEDDDSLVCELRTNESDDSLIFRMSRIDKIEMKDLSAAENTTEITVDMIKTELGNFLMQVLQQATKAVEAPEAGK